MINVMLKTTFIFFQNKARSEQDRPGIAVQSRIRRE